MDIKSWLEATGDPVAETAFIDETPIPSIVYLDHVERDGADLKNAISWHSLTVERYSRDGKGNEKLEALFDAKAIKYTKETTYLSNEQWFMTTYDFNLVERI